MTNSLYCVLSSGSVVGSSRELFDSQRNEIKMQCKEKYRNNSMAFKDGICEVVKIFLRLSEMCYAEMLILLSDL